MFELLVYPVHKCFSLFTIPLKQHHGVSLRVYLSTSKTFIILLKLFLSDVVFSP